jgi:uncharacterized protein YggL (DUF469 family)
LERRFVTRDCRGARCGAHFAHVHNSWGMSRRRERPRGRAALLRAASVSAACPLFGFVLQLRGTDARDRARLLDALRRDLLAGRGLRLTDGEVANAYIVIGDGFQATDADREAVIAWLAAQPLAAGSTVGGLDDVGHAA